MNTVISKYPTTVTYTQYEKTPMGFKEVSPKGTNATGIIINGGAGVVGGFDLLSNKSPSSRSTDIPVGVHTYVSDDDLEYLMKVPRFVGDIERGMIVVVKSKKLDQDATDNIASNDMLENAKIEGRPVTEAEIEAAGGEVKRDGTVDITEVREGVSPLKVRKEEAGKSFYEKGKGKNKNKKRK